MCAHPPCLGCADIRSCETITACRASCSNDASTTESQSGWRDVRGFANNSLYCCGEAGWSESEWEGGAGAEGTPFDPQEAVAKGQVADWLVAGDAAPPELAGASDAAAAGAAACPPAASDRVGSCGSHAPTSVAAHDWLPPVTPLCMSTDQASLRTVVLGRAI